MIEIIIIAIIWYAIGVFSFIYWWTKDYDFTPSEIPMALGAGLAGVFTFWLGYCIHGKLESNWIIVKKRKR